MGYDEGRPDGRGAAGDAGSEANGSTPVDGWPMRDRPLFLRLGRVPSLTLLLLAAGCGSDEPRDAVLDQGFLVLDGGGPLKREAQAVKPDQGGPTPGVKGKFCNGVTVSGQSVSLTLKVGTASMTAQSGGCSSCVTLPTGTTAMELFYQGSKLASGQVSIESSKEYVFWITYDAATQKTVLSGGALDPTQGQKCETYTPKL